MTFVASVLLAGLLIAIPCLPDGVNLDVAAELADRYYLRGRDRHRQRRGRGVADRDRPPALGCRVGDGDG